MRERFGGSVLLHDAEDVGQIHFMFAAAQTQGALDIKQMPVQRSCRRIFFS
ncbi:hypothetical protein [Collimonas silvisoli]|uniref:hypothetical protein n=1 Tax=Collimonas silvisoli TaxID=2825884 RepID=UPI001B8B1D22|nr:hypothetical protein [Collimonas silvisoli]